MEVCEICHREITSDEKYKVYQWNCLAHLSCYNKVFWLGIKLMIPMMICLIAGEIMVILGAIDLGEQGGSEWDHPMTSSAGDKALLAIGIILLITAVVCVIIYTVKYFAIRKNPPLPDKKDGPFTPTRDNE